MLIGVLALQGGFSEHMDSLRRLGCEVRTVRLPADLSGIQGLVLPGGESTTLTQLLERWELIEPMTTLIAQGLPTFGTCAGSILLSKQATDLDRPTFGAVDVAVKRNGYGRQTESFETLLDMACLGEDSFPAVFIRAPQFESIGDTVTVLGSLQDGSPVALRQGNSIATSFHPELTDDLRFHDYFLSVVYERIGTRGVFIELPLTLS